MICNFCCRNQCRHAILTVSQNFCYLFNSDFTLLVPCVKHSHAVSSSKQLCQLICSCSFLSTHKEIAF